MRKQVFLGCSGFHYFHWLGRFYPPDLHPGKWLEYYVRFFDSVEMNVTFYRFPSERMLKSWYKRTPKQFVFALKGNRLITHEKKLVGVDALIGRFYGLANLLGEKLGPILWQFPPSMRKDTKLLSSFLGLLRTSYGGYENVIEFRHLSWYSEEVYDLLREFGVGYCIVSCPDLPTHVVATADHAYIRFHGLEHWYRYDYSREELEEWARIIEELNAKKVYAYFNNDYNAWAPKNCLSLKEILSR
jgi:uncharacterized protein YecE (DUF72 family)